MFYNFFQRQQIYRIATQTLNICPRKTTTFIIKKKNNRCFINQYFIHLMINRIPFCRIIFCQSRFIKPIKFPVFKSVYNSVARGFWNKKQYKNSPHRDNRQSMTHGKMAQSLWSSFRALLPFPSRQLLFLRPNPPIVAP